MRRLLLVEDDASLGETLKERLEKEGYAVTWAPDLATAGKALEGSLDLIILDVNLPDGSGFAFAREFRKNRQTPLIFMTAMNSAEHRLEGYEIGAEEYIPKPFHLKELLLRVRHVLELHPTEAGSMASHDASPAATSALPLERLQIGDKSVDFVARAVIGPDGVKEFLQTRDFLLLKTLIEASPSVVSRDEILNRVWGEDKFPSSRTVDNAIVRLRQVIGDVGGKKIRSVRGVGYQWIRD